MSDVLTPKPKKRRPPILPFGARQRDARVRRVQLVRWLRKKGKTGEAKALAKVLKGCTPRQPCGSGACPSCMVTTQERLAKALRRLTAKTPKQLTVFVLTVVLERSATPVGSLIDFDISNSHRRIRRALNEAEVTWAVAGLDISLNEQANYPPFWMPHHWIVGVTSDINRLKKFLKQRWLRSPRVFRPIKLQEWDGQPNALYYTLKSKFDRRVAYNNRFRLGKNGKIYPCHDTQKQQLRSAERLELMLWLDDYAILTRVTTSQLKLKTANARLRLLKTDGSHLII